MLPKSNYLNVSPSIFQSIHRVPAVRRDRLGGGPESVRIGDLHPRIEWSSRLPESHRVQRQVGAQPGQSALLALHCPGGCRLRLPHRVPVLLPATVLRPLGLLALGGSLQSTNSGRGISRRAV